MRNPITKHLTDILGRANVDLGSLIPNYQLSDNGTILAREQLIGEMRGLTRLNDEVESLIKQIQQLNKH